MSTFVLVPGAWLGAWCFQEVAAKLRERGHTVYPLSLTGIAERSHLGSTQIDLDTHIADIVNLVETEELQDVFLVGHSYAGMLPVPAAARRLGTRLRQVVYLDSAPLSPGMSMLDMMPAEAAGALREQVRAQGAGWRYDCPPPEELQAAASVDGMDQAMLDRLRRKATAHPFGAYTQPFPAGGEDVTAVSLIACHDMRKLLSSGIPLIDEFAVAVQHRTDLDTGHWPMLSAPDAVATALHEFAEASHRKTG